MDQLSENSENHTFEDDEAILDEATIVKNLSNFARTADGDKFAYLKLSMPGSNLSDIGLIGNYKELQVLDLSYNKIKDLSVLSELKYLVSLNVSNNQLEKLFDFLTPFNLKEACFSFNQIREIGNLSNYHYLQTLDLSHNKVERIEGLEYCHRLKSLDLSNNQIAKIEGLNNLPLISLSLASNKIKKIEGLNSLRFLRSLDLSNNQLRSLSGIPEKHEFIEKLFLQDNKISNIADLDFLVNLKLLRNLTLKSNPIRELENCRLIILYKLPHLELLDGKKIESVEKVDANDLFCPNVEFIASRDHMANLVFNSIQDHKVKESTLPDINSPYPILILCGADGTGSSELALRLAKEFPEYFDFVPLHTTRKQKPTEGDKYFYKFLSPQEFDDNVFMGNFICCNEYFGDWYGLKWDSIESVAMQGLACVMHLELESLISFKKTYFEPRCVLITTLDRKVQNDRLTNEGLNEFECEIARARSDWYEEYNNQHPGFFDAVILTDEFNNGFITLKNLVLNYLGVGTMENSLTINNIEADSKNSSMHTNFTKSMDRKFPRPDPTDLQRTDSFLPSNTATGNRSQMSHMSIDSLSQLYNQNMRLKFGSAPAELLRKGEHAEKSIEKRINDIKKQFETNHLVNSRSQIMNSLNKNMRDDTMSSNSIRKQTATASASKPNTTTKTNKPNVNKTNKPLKASPSSAAKSNKYEINSDSSSTDDFDF